MLKSRQARFPEMIAQAAMPAEEADRQIRIFEEIVAEWHWICTGEGSTGSYLTLSERREALEQSLATIAGIARQQGGFSQKLAQQAESVIAMLWHADRERNFATLSTARLNHELKKELRHAA